MKIWKCLVLAGIALSAAVTALAKPAAGMWTTDVEGVMNALDCKLALVLFSEHKGTTEHCWSDELQTVLDDKSFTDWAKTNGVYLITSNANNLPAGCADADAAWDYFWRLWRKRNGNAMARYGSFAIVKPNDFETAVDVPVVWNDGTCKIGDAAAGQVVYNGTAASLIAGLSFCFEPGGGGNEPELVEYKINYADTKGAANQNPTSYTVEDVVTFAPLADVGEYVFNGWSPASIAKGTTGDLTVTALWKRNSDPEPESDFVELVRGVAIDPIELDVDMAGVKSVSVKKLPSGLKFTAKATKDYAANTIYGTPKKSGVYTAVITITKTDRTKDTREMKFVVRAAGEVLVDVEFDSACGKVTGAGVYAPGKTVTLKATAKKGYVFSGWSDASGGTVESSASMKCVVPASDVTFVANFITVAEDLASVTAAVGDYKFDAETLQHSVECYAGVYLELPVSASGSSAVTVKVGNPPSGLKFTAKDVVDKKTGKDVPANTIYGTPSKGGKTTATKITVTTAAKSKRTFVLNVTVLALPDWAVGTFSLDKNNSVKTTAAGKISGKWTDAAGKKWTVSATGFSGFAGDKLTGSVPAKSGKETKTVDVTVVDGTLTIDGVELPRSGK